MTEAKPTPSEIKARIRASKQKPKPKPLKCPTCAGTGEVTTAARHAVRCPTCFGSCFVRKQTL